MCLADLHYRSQAWAGTERVHSAEVCIVKVANETIQAGTSVPKVHLMHLFRLDRYSTGSEEDTAVSILDLVSKRDSPGVIRARPILLTTLAVVPGSAIMLTDPVFGGLAISLIFGTFASSALTIIIMVPVFHYRAKRGNTDQIDRSGTFVSLPEAKS